MTAVGCCVGLEGGRMDGVMMMSSFHMQIERLVYCIINNDQRRGSLRPQTAASIIISECCGFIIKHGEL